MLLHHFIPNHTGSAQEHQNQHPGLGCSSFLPGMKKFILLVFVLMSLRVTSVVMAMSLYDSFSYPVGNLGAVGSAGGWDATSQSIIAVTSGSLGGPSGFPPATNNMITLSKGTGVNYVTFASSGQMTSGQVYFSFLFKPGSSSGTSSTGLDIAALTAQDSSSPAVTLQLRNNSGFKLGVKKAGGTAVFPTSTLTAGATYLVIGKYDFATSPHTVSVWILTTFATTESAAGAPTMAINSGADFSSGTGIGRFYLNGAGVPNAAVNIDELRIGSTWAAVVAESPTPPPFQFAIAPRITQSLMAGGSFILRGSNGTPSTAYEVLCATNTSLPLAQWSVVGSNSFDAFGQFDHATATAGFGPRFYRLRCGSTTNSQPGIAPTISSQPQDQSATVGQGALFSVTASGSAPLRYQWFFNTNSPIPDATNASYLLSNVTLNDAGGYSVRVTNGAGAVTSSVAVLTIAPAPTNGDWLVSPTGNDANPGTLAAPFATLGKAVALALPGQTIYVRGGTYFPNATIHITNSGAPGNRINLLAYPGEQPYFNFTNQPVNTENRGIRFTTAAAHWNVQGLEIGFAGDNGIKVEGSYLRFERCIFHNNNDTGLQIGFGHTDANPGGLLAAFIEVVNCDSYQNFDPAGNGGNADGFAAKMHCGQGITFSGCRAWENGDDGWDLFETDYSVVISNCWTWKSAMLGGQGNGNGFKLGGDGAGGQSKGTHSALHCVSFGNKVNGFTQNSHRDGLLIQNCLSFANGNSGYDYYMEGTMNSGKQNVFRNNVGLPKPTGGGIFIEDNNPVQDHNSWNLTVTPDTGDYASLLESSAKAPRKPDGSLPDLFARLVSSSDLIDKGVDTGVPFTGSAPDLGPYEFSP